MKSLYAGKFRAAILNGSPFFILFNISCVVIPDNPINSHQIYLGKSRENTEPRLGGATSSGAIPLPTTVIYIGSF